MVRKVTDATAEIAATEIAKEVFTGDIATVDHIYTNPGGDPLGLVARLAKVMGDLPVLEPAGKNKFFNYKFITDKQVLGIVRPRLSRQLILVIPETVEEREPIQMTTQKGGTSLMTRITVTWRVVCGISGESFTGQSVGYGDDSGDKGANKAFTAALKNYFLKLFEIGGDADIEEDEDTDKRAKTRESGSSIVGSAVIGETSVEGVERGGKASAATEAQISRVGQYIRDLQMDAPAFAALLSRKFDTTLSLGEDPWQDVRSFLTSLTGTRIGKIIAALDEMYAAIADAHTEEAEGGGYGS
jgi:hypothetical protein